MKKKMNVSLDKITLNIGVGQGGEALENGRNLLKILTGKSPVTTHARSRNPTFNIRKDDPIGVKVTLRGKEAAEFLKKALDVVDFKIPGRSADENGNVAFGVKEYIDFPGAKYDPKIGMLGFDVCLTLKKPGLRVARRKIASRRLPKKQRVSSQEAKEFLKTTFNVNFVEENKE